MPASSIRDHTYSNKPDPSLEQCHLSTVAIVNAVWSAGACFTEVVFNILPDVTERKSLDYRLVSQ